MACSVTAGRTIDCRDSVGGLKAVFFCSTYNNNTVEELTLTASSYTITDAGFADWTIVGTPTTGDVTVYKYDLVTDLSDFKPAAIEADKATGSVMWNQTLNIVLQKIAAADLFQLQKIAQDRMQIFVQDSNDNVFLMGAEDGCYLTGGDTISTGASRSDAHGLNLTFTAKERVPSYILAATDGAGTALYPFDGLVDSADLTIL